MMLTDFRLLIFKTAASELNFSKTAKKLDISQPAVSMNITELENILGDKLFIRKGNSMQLTEKGRLFENYVERILHLYDMMNRELIPQNLMAPEKLTVLSESLPAKFVMQGIVANFRRAYPHVKLTLLERDRNEILEAVESGDADLGVVACPGNETMWKDENFNENNELNFARFADFTVGASGRAYLCLYFVYPTLSAKSEIIRDFILSSDTLV